MQSKLFKIKNNSKTAITIDSEEGNLLDVASINDTYTGVYQFDNIFILKEAKAETQDMINLTGIYYNDGTGILQSGGINYQIPLFDFDTDCDGFDLPPKNCATCKLRKLVYNTTKGGADEEGNIYRREDNQDTSGS